MVNTITIIINSTEHTILHDTLVDQIRQMEQWLADNPGKAETSDCERGQYLLSMKLLLKRLQILQTQ